MSNELDNLEKQIAILQAKKQTILDSKRKAVLEDMRKAVVQYGFTARELGLSVPDRKTCKAQKDITFRDAVNNLEWDGELTQKGRKPQWIKDRVADGTIEQYRVST